ncbi:Glutathione S-transferase DHAR3 [Spatholobus suberectus]|nr:Glutathione S-transferase DHAR3 [Spatholobus suberectus]
MSTARFQASACALSATVNHLRLRPNAVVSFTNHFGLRPLRKKPLRVSMSSAPPSQPFEVAVKASVTTPNRIGDCPFCQRVLLTLEEKHLPYDPKLVDLANKPEWFLKVNPDGKVPVIKFDEKWVPDSDVITQTLEEKYPSPPLVTPPEKATVGSKIFSTFIGFLKSKDPNDGTQQALLSELSSFNDYLKENGPFINGNEISAADLSLGPKLYHLEIVLGHYKKWTVPESLTSLKSYMKAIFSRESFVKTSAQPQDVIEGWRPKVEG